MKKVEVNCDNCEKDLRFTAYASEYYISVLPTAKSRESNVAYAMSRPSPLTREFHFCNLQCLLEKWENQRR